MVLYFFQTFVLPYVIVLGIAFLTVWFGLSISKSNERRKTREALRAELRSNMVVTKELTAYADSQLSGETSVAPMPTYRNHAYRKYKGLGLLERLPEKIGQELEHLYLNMESVNKAGRRQEELAFGPAAAYPNAHTLRLENLTYVRDTTHNIIEPYQDRLKDHQA